MNRWLRSLFFLGALFSFSALVFAQGNTGTVTGRVANGATGAYLEGAEVSIEGSAAKALTDRDGSFRLNGVPAGSQSLRVYYTGLDVATQTINVTAGSTADTNVSLGGGVYQLDVYKVSGEREGQAASITKQRNADNVMNVVSTDAFGNVADGNLGNFMVRLPGVSAEETSNGDIIGIKIRGTPAEYSAVNMDGTRVSNAIAGFNPTGDRAALIDQFPSEFIKEVEVIKGLRPDMPADSIGGATNLITKSALDFKESVLTYNAGFSYNTYRDSLGNFTPVGSLSYLTQIGRDHPLGVALSLSYNVTETPRDRMQLQRVDPDDRMGQARTLAEVNTRERAGAGLKFDYRLGENTLLTAKFNYAMYHYEGMREIAAATATGTRRVADYSRVSRAQIEAGTVPLDSTGQAAGIAPDFTGSYTEMLNATWTNEMGRVVRYGRNYLGEISGETKLANDQKIEFQASHNPSWFDADLPTFTTTLTNGLNTTAVGIGYLIDGRENRSRPKFIQTYGPNVHYGSNNQLYTATYSTGRGRTEEEISNVKADYTKAFKQWKNPVELKAGFDWREQHRWTFTSSYSYRVVGADGVAMRNPTTGINDDLLAFVDPKPGYGLMNGRYPAHNKYDILAVERASRSNPNWFLSTSTTAPTINEATEDVYAGYLQGKISVGKLHVLGGVRYELTDLSVQGRLQDPQRPTVTRITRDGEYNHFFPSIHFTYDIKPNLLARASFSTGSARPSLSDLYPGTTVVYDGSGADGVVTGNDPKLKPQYADNYDLSLEYYFEPAGVLSAGFFRKDISDFIYASVSQIGSGSDNGFNGLYSGFDYSSKTNGGDAKVEGYEINYMQQLTMLPKPFDRISIFANLTDLKTSGQYANGAADLAKFVPRATNMGFSYEWRGFQMRLAQRYTSSYMETYNANRYARVRFRPDHKLDFSMSYKFRRYLGVYVDVLNILNKWPDQYTGDDRGRIAFSNVYGTKINAGITGRF